MVPMHLSLIFEPFVPHIEAQHTYQFMYLWHSGTTVACCRRVNNWTYRVLVCSCGLISPLKSCCVVYVPALCLCLLFPEHQRTSEHSGPVSLHCCPLWQINTDRCDSVITAPRWAAMLHQRNCAVHKKGRCFCAVTILRCHLASTTIAWRRAFIW